MSLHSLDMCKGTFSCPLTLRLEGQVKCLGTKVKGFHSRKEAERTLSEVVLSLLSYHHRTFVVNLAGP